MLFKSCQLKEGVVGVGVCVCMSAFLCKPISSCNEKPNVSYTFFLIHYYLHVAIHLTFLCLLNLTVENLGLSLGVSYSYFY